MEIGSGEWQRFIIESARKLGIEVDEAITALFSVHAAELLTWNRKINLTAITNPTEIAVKHFLDSLAAAEFVPDGARLLDIGSGAGFPGIPLKILKPSTSVLLIDAVGKKINFLKHVLRLLNLESVEARQIRAEDLLKDPDYAATFDVVISRALSDLSLFVKSAMPLLAKRGAMIAMKAKMDSEELDAVRECVPGARYSLEIETYELPSFGAPRSLVIIEHIG